MDGDAELLPETLPVKVVAVEKGSVQPWKLHSFAVRGREVPHVVATTL